MTITGGGIIGITGMDPVGGGIAGTAQVGVGMLAGDGTIGMDPVGGGIIGTAQVGDGDGIIGMEILGDMVGMETTMLTQEVEEQEDIMETDILKGDIMDEHLIQQMDEHPHVVTLGQEPEVLLHEVTKFLHVTQTVLENTTVTMLVQEITLVQTHLQQV